MCYIMVLNSNIFYTIPDRNVVKCLCLSVNSFSFDEKDIRADLAINETCQVHLINIGLLLMTLLRKNAKQC